MTFQVQITKTKYRFIRNFWFLKKKFFKSFIIRTSHDNKTASNKWGTYYKNQRILWNPEMEDFTFYSSLILIKNSYKQKKSTLKVQQNTLRTSENSNEFSWIFIVLKK